ncbi:hypothetical protein SAMN05660479_01007 [Microbulbifer thermotolerans]|nr:hypothetical protein SAMN05660479_01007 [Microbulbifer thermotolerans]
MHVLRGLLCSHFRANRAQSKLPPLAALCDLVMQSSNTLKQISNVEIGLGFILALISMWLFLNTALDPIYQEPHSIGRIIPSLSLLGSLSLLIPGVALRVLVKVGTVLQSLVIIFAVFIMWLGTQ